MGLLRRYLLKNLRTTPFKYVQSIVVHFYPDPDPDPDGQYPSMYIAVIFGGPFSTEFARITLLLQFYECCLIVFRAHCIKQCAICIYELELYLSSCTD